MNLLFICNQGENRSLTAQHMFQEKDGYNTKSGGLHSEESKVNKALLKWADVVFVFEQSHIDSLKERFPKQWYDKRIINLDIPDQYDYGNPFLKDEITKKMKPWWSFLKSL